MRRVFCEKKGRKIFWPWVRVMSEFLERVVETETLTGWEDEHGADGAVDQLVSSGKKEHHHAASWTTSPPEKSVRIVGMRLT